jgi:two-component system, NarL family, sensor histidine kinase UhpB
MQTIKPDAAAERAPLGPRSRMIEGLGVAIAGLAALTATYGIAVGGTVTVAVGLLLVGAAVSLVVLQRWQRRSLEQPLAAVERTLESVERGDFRARAEVGPGADPALARAAAALNRLLTGVVSDRQRLRDVAARAFRAQEAERLRIARELQEDTAQTLSTGLFLLRAARQTEERGARDEMLDELRDNLTRTTDAIRGYARVLHPPALKDLGLVAALESYARSLSSSSGLEVQIVADDISGVLPIEGELALYRIVQEALGNVVRHARATAVLVRVRNAGDAVRTLVEDDGCGFSLEEAEARLPSLGLFGMRERALSVGGTVEIDSIPGDGTSVRVSIPAARRSGASQNLPLPVILRPSEAALPGSVPLNENRPPGAA